MKFGKDWRHALTAGNTASHEALLGEEPKLAIVQHHHIPGKSQANPWKLLLLMNSLLLCLSIGFFVASSSNRRPPTSKVTSRPSLERIEMGVKSTTLDGTVSISNDTKTIWGKIGPDAEAVWDSFDKIRTLALTREEAVRLGKDPSILAKFDDATWGFGDDAYVGGLDIFHQIHCLNVLRKKAFQDHPSNVDKQQSNTSSIEWQHLQHCLSITMQHLLCTGTTGMLTYNWMEGQIYPMPDFSVNRQCRDWTQLTRYRDDNAVDLATYKAWERPSDAVVIPRSKDLLELDALLSHGGGNSGHE